MSTVLNNNNKNRWVRVEGEGTNLVCVARKPSLRKLWSET